MLELFLEAGNLKRLRRTGWLMRGVPNPESIADHSFRTALVVMFLADELSRKGLEIDACRALRIALIHDIGEARITDIPSTVSRYVNKSEAERRAVLDMFKRVPGGEEYSELWLEYEEENTVEGRLVKFADRLEMLIQAYEYERAGFRNLDEFWETVEWLRKSEFYPYFSGLVEELLKLRKQNNLR
jgi:putative hydrolase of HD superfamily